MKSQWSKRLFVMGILSAVCLLGPGTALAQQGAGVQSGGKYSNNELQSFIMANSGIYHLQQQVNTQMESVQTEQEKQQLMQAFNQQVAQVIQNADLTIDEYRRMSEAIQSDSNLQERTNALAQQIAAQQQQQ